MIGSINNNEDGKGLSVETYLLQWRLYSTRGKERRVGCVSRGVVLMGVIFPWAWLAKKI